MLYQLIQNGGVHDVERGRWFIPDGISADSLEYQLWVAAGNTPTALDPPTAAQVQTEFTAAIQKRLDDFAHTRNYDGILSACTYATSAVTAFAAEGLRCVQARDATWTAAYALLADVLAGRRAMPTLSQVMAELPVLSWT
jgi:hypothetical protein